VPTPRAEQIKKTKTIPRVYMCDIGGVYRRLSNTKILAKMLSIGIFALLASTNAGRRKYKENKKMILP
jgi:hypothetical protein